MGKSNSASVLARGAGHLSKRLIVSYLFDWICLFAIAGVGGAFNRLHRTSKRAFSLQDPSLSYPYYEDTVSTGVLVAVSLIVPAVLTFIISILFVPGAGAPRGTSKALIWRRKLWEWNTAWMGLGLALASAFMITEGLKDLAGKPRPHTIALCRPRLDALSEYQVGGLGTDIASAVPILVNFGICEETNPQVLRNMFASWPSGHSSFSWAGLLYLSLWLSSKFAVTIPYLNPSMTQQKGRMIPTFNHPSSSKTANGRDSDTTEHQDNLYNGEGLFHSGNNPPRNQAAAPPVYLLILVFVPIGTAAFIAVSRWFDYHHHGFDIICGSVLGAFTAWFSFRYYHLPIRRGAGWSWGARSRGRAFWLGVGRDTYVGEEGWKSKKSTPQIVQERRDIEAGKSSENNNGVVPGPSDM